MVRHPATTALLPIMLAACTALASCANNGDSSKRPTHRSTTARQGRSAPIIFNFETHKGFKYKFTGTSAFYSATGDPNFPMEEPLPPGLTYLVLYGNLTNLLKDRPAPSPVSSDTPKSFGGMVIPSQTKRIPVYDETGKRSGTLPTCRWPKGEYSGNGAYLNTDAVPGEDKNYSPSDEEELVPVRNNQNLCAATLGFNPDNYPSEGIPAGSSYPSAILCIIPDSTPKSSIKFAVWSEPLDAYGYPRYDLDDSKYGTSHVSYHNIASNSVRDFPWSAPPKLGNN